MKKVTIIIVRIFQVLQSGIDWIIISMTGYKSYCKHSPTCSEYTIQQIKQRGTIIGLLKGFRQFLSCR